MASRQAPAPPKPALLSPEQMTQALPKLDRRISELEKFNAYEIEKRFDPLLESLKLKVNGTLEEIFGAGTDDFMKFRVGSFDSLGISMGRGQPAMERVRADARDNVSAQATKLKTLRSIFLERIEDAKQEIVPLPPSAEPREPSNRVFVVHGHDDGKKQTVARFLEKLGLVPIVLHEQSSASQTIIEKFEMHADVAFAVILLTDDDVGGPKGSTAQHRGRARQNVILEMGYFWGKLGRGKVCALKSGDVEIPSDYSGVLYEEMDAAGSWRLKLAAEMKRAGLKVDMNDVL